ncbi:MAG: hypothetical protein RLZZ417_1693 [Bacteroidota bacterium]|jgi:hypothetical protein
MIKNKDFLPNNLFLKNYPNSIIYSLFRIKVSEQLFRLFCWNIYGWQNECQLSIFLPTTKC